MTTKWLTLLALDAALTLAACGGSSGPASHPAHPGASPGATAPSAASTAPTPSETASTAAGDIPDNQVFLTFSSPRLGISIRYPEGWTQHVASQQVSFVQNTNEVTVTLSRGPAPGPGDVRAQLAAERRRLPRLSIGSITSVALPAGRAVKASYSLRSKPDPVTGKRLVLVVDRYVLARDGRIAVLDLATAKGVDNVDAYRMISRSFRWR